FVGTVDDNGVIQTARVVARGDVRSVLALPGFAQKGEMLLHNHPSGELEPSNPDLEIATKMHDQGVGFASSDNGASRVYVVVEVPRKSPVVCLDTETIEKSLGPDGEVAKLHQQY